MLDLELPVETSEKFTIIAKQIIFPLADEEFLKAYAWAFRVNASLLISNSDDFVFLIQIQQALIVEKNRRRNTDNRDLCSVCGQKLYGDEYSFCPNCGNFAAKINRFFVAQQFIDTDIFPQGFDPTPLIRTISTTQEDDLSKL